MVVLEVLTFTGSEEYISTRGSSFEVYPFRPAEGLQRYGIIGSESKTLLIFVVSSVALSMKINNEDISLQVCRGSCTDPQL